MKRAKQAAHAVWAWVSEPKAETITQWSVYLVLTVTGAAAALYPPSSIEGILGESWMLACTVMLTAGGLLGVLVTLRGIWWLEKVAIYLLAGAVGMYLATVVEAQLEGEGQRYLQIGILAAFLLLMLKRWLRIRRGSFDPEK